MRSYAETYANELSNPKENKLDLFNYVKKYFKSSRLGVFVSLEEILKLEYLVIAIPAQQISSWLKENFIFSNQKILVAAKGIEASSGRFLNDIYKDYVPDENIAFLSGPSFATEVRKSLPTALVINSYNEELSSKFATFFPSDAVPLSEHAPTPPPQSQPPPPPWHTCMQTQTHGTHTCRHRHMRTRTHAAS